MSCEMNVEMSCEMSVEMTAARIEATGRRCWCRWWRCWRCDVTFCADVVDDDETAMTVERNTEILRRCR